MKALDTNIIVRMLVGDDEAQGRKVKKLLEEAERSKGRFLLTTPVVLETVWVLTAVYDFNREETLHALEMLTQLPVLEFQDYDGMLESIRLARTTRADIPDLLIGSSAKACGCEATLTFDKDLAETGRFERL